MLIPCCTCQGPALPASHHRLSLPTPVATQAAGLNSFLADPNLAVTVFGPTTEAFTKTLAGERPNQHSSAVACIGQRPPARGQRLAALPPTLYLAQGAHHWRLPLPPLAQT